MHFDPAIAAQVAFTQVMASGQLGADVEAAREAEDIFSGSAGQEAKAAYEVLQALGDRYPDAQAFQEFLIYITWQQVTEETIPRHFHAGLERCNDYLARFGRSAGGDDMSVGQIRALRESFRGGLGLSEDDDHETEYDKDAFKGGD